MKALRISKFTAVIVQNTARPARHHAGGVYWVRAWHCTGVDHVHVVSEDGSPHGPKSFVLWNPPFAAPAARGSGGKGLNMSHTEGRKRGGAKRSLTLPDPALLTWSIAIGLG